MEEDTSYEDYENWYNRIEQSDWENREAFGMEF